MGFIGGHRSKSVGRNKLSLTRYKPCRTSQQSGTMCEMCPGTILFILEITYLMILFKINY